MGTDYLRDLAEILEGKYVRDARDVGIIASLEELAGPDFDPAAIDPLVREFYEHTTRFKLDIVPEWRMWVRPGYLLYRSLVARPLGKPTSQSTNAKSCAGSSAGSTPYELTATGGDSWLDLLLRRRRTDLCWHFRTYRHEDRGYVSVGVPLLFLCCSLPWTSTQM